MSKAMVITGRRDLAADAVLQMAGLPLSANVQFMTIMATKCR